MPGGTPGAGLDDQGREEDAARRVDARSQQSNRKAVTMTDITVLTVAQATKEIGLSEPTMRRRAAADPAFPRKIKLSTRRVGYLRRDIEAYLTRQREAAAAS